MTVAARYESVRIYEAHGPAVLPITAFVLWRARRAAQYRSTAPSFGWGLAATRNYNGRENVPSGILQVAQENAPSASPGSLRAFSLSPARPSRRSLGCDRFRANLPVGTVGW